jgi:cell division protein FtsN
MPPKKNTSSKKRSRKKSGATRYSKKKPSIVNWMILFVLIGIFVTFLLYLDKMPTSGKENGQTVIAIEAQSGQNKNKPEQAEKKLPQHQFDFYTVLPDREVDVYEGDEVLTGQSYTKQPEHLNRTPTVTRTQTATSAKTSTTISSTRSSTKPKTASTRVSTRTPVSAPKQQSVTKSTKSTKSGWALYQLQVGAFKDLSKADAMKARLAFMGVESNIYVLRSANGQKIYRVRVGPNSDEKKLSKIQQQLKAQNINTFMQKLKG